MNITEVRAREQRRTQAAPVNLEHGAFEPGQVVTLWIIAGAGLGIGSFGGLLVTWGSAAMSSSWEWVAGLGLWLAIFGVLLMILSYAVAVAIAVLASRGWWRHQERVDDWHYAQLAAYESNGGQESAREVLSRTLTTTEPAHVLLVALCLAERARKGESTPWSSPKLTGALWYGNLKLGDLSKTEAEEFSKLFGEIGLITGRRKGFAGQLAVEGEGAILQLVAQNYNKYLPGRIERAEEVIDQ